MHTLIGLASGSRQAAAGLGYKYFTPEMLRGKRFRLPPSSIDPQLWRTGRPISPFSYVGQVAAPLGFALVCFSLRSLRPRPQRFA